MLLAELVLDWPGLKRLRDRCEVRCGRGMMVGKLASACLSSLACLAFEGAAQCSRDGQLGRIGGAGARQLGQDAGRAVPSGKTAWSRTGTADGAQAQAGEARLLLAKEMWL